MRISITMRMCAALALLPVSPWVAKGEPAHGFEAPEGAVWLLFDRFEHRDAQGYVAGMSDDFRFDSDDPEFASAWPAGMRRDDELAFATHLFQGMPAREGRPALPAVAYVLETIGPMRVNLGTLTDGRIPGVIENQRIVLVFSDSSRMELGSTRSEFEMVLTESGWRIRRWHESVGGGGLDVPGLARAGVPGVEGIASDSVARPDIAAAAPRLAEIPTRAGGAPSTLMFDVALAGGGGALELFDVQGRRVAARDLSGLPPGRQPITIDGTGVPAGVYWARLRQPGQAVAVRVLWSR